MSTTGFRTSTLSRTAGYYGALLTFGLMGAAWGPALPFLASSTGADLARISLIFTALAFGGLIGTTAGGRSYDRFPGHLIMAAALFAMAATAVFIPLATALWFLLLLIFIFGAGAGVMAVGANTLLVWIHQDNVGPWVAGLHFFSGLGAIVAPLIIVMVISASDTISTAFWIMALIIVIPAVWLLAVKSPVIRAASQEGGDGQINYKVIIPIAVIFLLYVGAEVGFAGWLFTNTITLHPGSETMAGYLTTAFWVAFTAGRLAAIIILTRIRARSFLAVDFTGCLMSLGLILGFSSSPEALWIGAIGLGFFMSPIFPIMLTYTENRLKLSGKVSGVIFGASALGGMTIPLVIGQVFEAAGPRETMIAFFVDLLLAFIVFTVLEYSLSRGMRQIASG